MKRTGLFFIFNCLVLSLAFGSPSPGKAKTLLTVKVRQGQGAFGLLRSYKLIDIAGNLDLFYQLNGLSRNAELVKNKTYKLPVSIHSFDGKSIRSSVGIDDLEKAKQIENYNKSLVNSDVRKKLFKDDKRIWVPISIIDKYDLKKSESENSQPSKVLNQKRNQFQKEDNRKQFVTASIKTMKPVLVADHKLTREELLAVSKNKSESANSSLATKVSSKSLSIPLFGDKYESVPLVSDELADEVFYIIPGHGGPDPGAMSKNVDGEYTICEDEYAYDVSLRLAKDLIEKGATVYVIVQDKNDGIRDEKYLECDCDEKSLSGRDIPLSQKKRLRQGINYVNKLYSKHKKEGIKKQWMVSLHIDSRSEESRQDVFFYYQSESETSKNKALDIQKVFEEKYQIYRKSQEYKGTVSSRPLYVVRHSDPEPIYIELANIQNPEDQKRILYPKNRQLLADWITEGFLK